MLVILICIVSMPKNRDSYALLPTHGDKVSHLVKTPRMAS